MDPLVYVPVRDSTKKLVSFLREPAATYWCRHGKLIGFHWYLNQIAVEKLRKRFGNVFQVVQQTA